MGDDIDETSGDGSSASGVSSTGDNKSLMEGADGTSGAVEDHREWKKLTRRHGR